MDYKSTLNLPKTSFPMKANLPQTEPEVLARWEEEKLYGKVLARRKGAQPFILHDGPPYANGDIHIGHAFNKVLKDLIVRYHTMRGRLVPYVPGWDCHGLPIEYALMKELKVTKHQVDTVEFRRKARAYALKYVGVQREQFKRLGVSGDWDHPYLTLDPEYVAAALRSLGKLVEKGFVYRARKPVNWCWSCETALAEAEVEYEDHRSRAIFVKFELTDDAVNKLVPSNVNLTGPVYLVIWTTTPWTLLGNVAVAVHPSLQYAARRNVGTDMIHEVWITLTDPPPEGKSILQMHNRDKPEQILFEVKGSRLENLTYLHPFRFREGRVVLADYVSTEQGTGLVHTAPGFGNEDYMTGRKYNLEMPAPVDARGRFYGLPQPVEELNGLHVQEQASDWIIARLKQSHHLIAHLAQDEEIGYRHQYPHCWRCHEPIIFRATDQWFLNVEHEGLRGKLLELIGREVQWIPPVGRERMAGMVKTRPDWCLSRQRLWGIPIPAVICRKCGEGFLEPRVIEAFAAAVEKEEEGSDRWFSEPVEKWLPANFDCRKDKGGCGGKTFDKGTDILDVWFDSGVSHQAVLRRRSDLRHPAEMYLEGSDQHRGWFQVSLITGAALEGKAPYRAVLTHGFVVDGEGRKMSKSLGNVIAPQEVISSYGADVLRLWVASSDYAEDVRLSKAILEQAAEAYRKIRNTLRFCLANISDYVPKDLISQKDSTRSLDRWILSELGSLVDEVTDAYDAYAFHRAVKAIHEFCTVRLSNFYLDVVKDVLYTAHPDDPGRRSAQAALYKIAETLTLLLAPILPVTTEEAWGSLPGKEENKSVHLVFWPSDVPTLFYEKPEARADWEKLLALRDGAMKALEQAREAKQIGDALEAELEVTVGDPRLWEFLNARQEEFQMACLVSGLRLSRGQVAGAGGGATTRPGSAAGPGVSFRVAKASGAKCQRCWMRLPSVGQSAEHPGLCSRCVGVLQKLAADGKL